MSASTRFNLGERFAAEDAILNQSENVSIESLRGKTLFFYFSAKWCPPCRLFTPVLTESYKLAKETNANDFELIFVSRDHDADGFNAYYETMPWLALNFDAEEVRTDLKEECECKAIPQVTVMRFVENSDKSKLEWEVVSHHGKMAIKDEKEKAILQFIQGDKKAEVVTPAAAAPAPAAFTTEEDF